MTDREWMLHAACRGCDPEAFFPHPKDKQAQREATAICRECPVIGECARYAKALRVTDGVWAGRYRALPARGIRNYAYTDWHGTAAGANRHWRAGEKPCQKCSSAQWEARKQRIGAR